MDKLNPGRICFDSVAGLNIRKESDPVSADLMKRGGNRRNHPGDVQESEDMVITVHDDFDLEKISLSGQCFRVGKFDTDVFRFLCGNHVLYMKAVGKGEFSVSCTGDEWKSIWNPYFDLDRSYRDLVCKETGKNKFTDEAMAFGRGLRVLRQDPWEMLVTFIISQRKNIPAISKAVELLARKYGRKLETEYETVYSFPSPSEMKDADEDSLRRCALGYRARYVIDAVSRVLSGKTDLQLLSFLGDDALLEELQKICGVGRKVANCVALFAYGRTACVPVDVWISRAIDRDFEGESPFPLFGEHAGIIQQYIYYYERMRSFES